MRRHRHRSADESGDDLLSGDASPSVVTATSAPPIGRITVWTRVPERIEPRHFVRDEFDDVHHERDGDDDRMLERAETDPGSATRSKREQSPSTATVA